MFRVPDLPASQFNRDDHDHWCALLTLGLVKLPPARIRIAAGLILNFAGLSEYLVNARCKEMLFGTAAYVGFLVVFLVRRGAATWWLRISQK